MNWLSCTNENKPYQNLSPSKLGAPPKLLAHAEALNYNAPSLDPFADSASSTKQQTTMAKGHLVHSNFNEPYSDFNEAAQFATGSSMRRKFLQPEID